MSHPLQELFYDGYDPQWILGKDKGPPVEPKPKPLAPKPEQGKPQPPPPIELKVPFCCEGCKEKMNDAFNDIDGIESVKMDLESGKITITGKAKPEECLKAARKLAPRSEMWPKKKEDKKDEKKDEKKNAGGGGKKQEKKEEKKEEAPPPPIELKVNMCCEGCAAKLYQNLRQIDEVVEVSMGETRIIVKGKAKPEKVLKVARKLKPGAELILPKKK